MLIWLTSFIASTSILDGNEKLNGLSEKDKKAFSAAYKDIRTYQGSKMGTHEWHALGNVCDAIKVVESLFRLHAYSIERPHIAIEDQYCSTLNRTRCVKNELIEDLSIGKNRYLSNQWEPECFLRINPTKRKVKEDTNAYIVQRGPKTTLECITRVLQHRKTDSHHPENSKALISFEHDFFRCL